jgi:hypothetical protein
VPRRSRHAENKETVMKNASKGILMALAVGTLALGASVADAASWVGSGWQFTGGAYRHTVNGKSADYWVNTVAANKTRSRNVTSFTPHWAMTECIAWGLPAQYPYASTWSGANGPENNTTPLCPSGYTLYRGGTFIFN